MIEGGARSLRLTRAAFAAVTAVVGVLDVIINPASINPDGVAYIDVGRALLAGERQGVVGYWSPLYSVFVAGVLRLFHATAANEVLIARCANLVLLALAAVAFEALVTAWITRLRATGALQQEIAWRAGAYAVFLWTCVRNIGIAEITPDLGVAAAVFAATALILNDGAGSNARRGTLIGVVLGIGYLNKAVLFVVAFPILAVYAWRSGVRPASRALGMFVLVASPWIALLSSVKGRPTFGDVGSLNVVWYNSSIRPYQHWQGDEAGLGTPTHPTRRLRRNPEVFEFATPFRVSYAPWYDASYWYEGVNSRVPLGTMFARATKTIRGTAAHLWPLAVGVLLALMLARGAPRPTVGLAKDVAPLLVPALFTYAIYAPIALYTRYLAAAAALLYLGVFLAWSLSADTTMRRRLLLAWCVVGALVAGHASRELLMRGRESLAGTGLHWRDRDDVVVAQQLQPRYAPGTPVAGIGSTGSWMYWPHFAGFRMVAESPNVDDVHFWAAPDTARRDALCLMQRAGAAFVVSDSLPSALDSGWTRVADTRYAFRTLDDACVLSTAQQK